MISRYELLYIRSAARFTMRMIRHIYSVVRHVADTAHDGSFLAVRYSQRGKNGD